MKIRAKLSLKSDAAIAAREGLGLTQAQVAKSAGVSASDVSAIECMRLKGVGQGAIKRLSDFYGIDVDVLAPPELRDRDKSFEAIAVREVSLPALLTFDHAHPDLISGDHAEQVVKNLDDDDVKDRLHRMLDGLTFREREVLKLYYGIEDERGVGRGEEFTFEEIARIFRITRARAQQILWGAIRKLQSPPLAKQIPQSVRDPYGAEIP